MWIKTKQPRISGLFRFSVNWLYRFEPPFAGPLGTLLLGLIVGLPEGFLADLVKGLSVGLAVGLPVDLVVFFNVDL